MSDNSHTARVVCVGNVTHDYVAYTDALPELDDVSYVTSDHYELGGRGAIVAMILGALGVDSPLLTVVDERGLSEIEKLDAEHALDRSLIHVVPGDRGLFQVHVFVGKREQNCISFFVPKAITFELGQTALDEVKAARYLYFSTHKRDFNAQLLHLVDTRSTQVIHNVGSYFLADRDYVDLMLTKSSVLVGNRSEMLRLFTLTACTDAARLFEQRSNLDVIVITAGPAGATAYCRGEAAPVVCPAIDVPVCTPVGAGDAFAAGLVFGSVANWPIQTTMNFASQLAAVSVASPRVCPDVRELQSLARTFSLASQ